MSIKRNWTRELRNQQAKGWVVVASIQPYGGQPVVYNPRSKNDPQPWSPAACSASQLRYSGRECYAVRSCGAKLVGGQQCGKPMGHDKAHVPAPHAGRGLDTPVSPLS